MMMMMMLMISSRMEHSDSATLAVSQHHLPPSAPLPTVLQINLSSIQNVTGQLFYSHFPAKTSKTLFQRNIYCFAAVSCALSAHTGQLVHLPLHGTLGTLNTWCTLHLHGHTCPHFTTFAWPHLTIGALYICMATLDNCQSGAFLQQGKGSWVRFLPLKLKFHP